MNFLHAGVTGRQGGRVATQPAPAGRQPSGGLIDWRSVRRAEHACCCTAKPAVIAIMPATAARPHLTELLLCWHHYRVSRKSLDAAGATVLDLAGEPVGERSWPRAR